MSLPSQGGIGFGGLSRTRRRRRRPLRRVVLGVLVLAGVGAGVWMLTGGGGDDTAGRPETAGAERAATGASAAELARSPAGAPRRSPIDLAGAGVLAAHAGGDRPARAQTDATAAAQPARTTSGPAPQPEAGEAGRTLASPEPGANDLPTAGVDGGAARGGDPAAARDQGRPLGGEAIAAMVRRAEELLASNDPVAAREVLNNALFDERAGEADRDALRDRLAAINEDLVFSPRVDPRDPYASVYTVESGDVLSRIVHREGLAVDYRLIQRINRLGNPNSIYKGQRLKLISGPFNAVVDKSAFRLDLYLGPPEEPERWVYVRSFNVGLGEHDGTPVGVFTVRRHSKLVNPFWRNPRTGEEYAADDPENPIGEHWIGLRGLGQAETYSGYGIHGTIDPKSIGGEESMGCVRMLPDDVAMVYELLVEDISRVHIVE